MTEPTGNGLRARGITREFHDGQQVIRVLRGLELAVREGESVAIVGESGVGKSTLLHILGALDRPDGGEVELDGKPLFALGPRELARVRCRTMGFVFQFHHLLGDFDALENVMMPLLIAQESRVTARKKARETLERVGLAARLNHRPGQLSGGEQQRVAVARAVVGSPRVVLADEPTGSLHWSQGEEIMKLLKGLNDNGTTIVQVSHDERVAAFGRRLIELGDGWISADKKITSTR